MRKYTLYHAFNPPPKVVTPVGKGGADQSFKDEADINNIMRRYAVTGLLTDPIAKISRVGRFEDLSGSPEDFFEANLRIIEAKAAFAELPSGIREKFGNDVGSLLQFLSNPANRDEAVKLGLVFNDGAPTGKVPSEVKLPSNAEVKV